MHSLSYVITSNLKISLNTSNTLLTLNLIHYLILIIKFYLKRDDFSFFDLEFKKSLNICYISFLKYIRADEISKIYFLIFKKSQSKSKLIIFYPYVIKLHNYRYMYVGI